MERYIDADSALKRFEEIHGNKSDLLNCYNADWIVSFIETQPTADAREVKRGHWIYPDDHHIACTCSCCGWNGLLYESDVGGMPYCPSCGAKMDGEEQTQ